MIVSRTSIGQGSCVLVGLGPVNPLHDVVRSIPINKLIKNGVLVFIYLPMIEAIGPFSLLSFLNIIGPIVFINGRVCITASLLTPVITTIWHSIPIAIPNSHTFKPSWSWVPICIKAGLNLYTMNRILELTQTSSFGENSSVNHVSLLNIPIFACIHLWKP